MKLTSNIVIQNTEIDIKISETQTVTVYLNKDLNKDTEYLSIIKYFNPNTGLTIPLHKLVIDGEFNQPIALPDSLIELKINGIFKKPIVLPDSLRELKISGIFNQPIILPEKLSTLKIGGIFNQPIILTYINLERLCN